MLALVSMSCTQELSESAGPVSEDRQTLSSKLVGETEGEGEPGTLLVKVDEATASRIIRGEAEAVSREFMPGVSGTSLVSALPIQPKNMEVARKYGLHQWFCIAFDKDLPLMEAAGKVAKHSSVNLVQINSYLKPTEPEFIMEFNQSAITKAADNSLPFDDPYLQNQWNLINDGSLTANAAAGADVGVRDAWKLTAGDRDITVAVFDCAVNYMHTDLKDAVWVNEAEKNGTAGKDDDGNGYIDDIYGFNFVNCGSLTTGVINGMLENGDKVEGISGKALNWTSGSGHGTHVAGIIGATNGNGKGVSSIAGGSGAGDGVRLMSCQIFDGSKNASDAQSAAAFIYAADNGACIAQCSYATSAIITSDDIYINGNGEADADMKIKGSPLENAALKYFLDPANSNHESLEGNIAVFAAGNHANPYSGYPGALPYVLSVTAFGIDGLPGGYTNYGPGCKIAAPGGEYSGSSDYSTMILSTGVSNAASSSPGIGNDQNYVYMQGTSMACPHVSGVIALGLSYAKKLGKKFTREEFTSLLLTSTNDLDGLLQGSKVYDGQTISLDRYKGQMGTGTVDAWKFLMAIEGTPSVMVQVGEKAFIDLSEYLGGAASVVTADIQADPAVKTSLGMTENPVIKDGVMELTCTKIGAGKLILKSSVGKDSSMDDGIGGMDFSREISIVSRPFVSSNGGWL